VVALDPTGTETYNAENAELVQAAGPVIWLRGNVQRLVAKVEAKADRPALGADVLGLMDRRQVFYERVATHTIDIEGKRREDIALEILATLGMQPAGSP
jgi:shikimate kinase